MAQAEQNSTVKVHYTGKLEDGTVFDSSRDREPLEFQVGQGQVIPGFEQAVEGMSPGETKTTTVAPDNAYGQRRDDMVASVPKDNLPDDLDPEVGQQLQARDSEGQTIPVRITEVGDDAVTIDANHPLAGQKLTFDIEMVDVQ
ncbi:MAG: FKBP-type peptidyl-prolyl cis-trans isomerase [Planctomycetota bacterium]